MAIAETIGLTAGAGPVSNAQDIADLMAELQPLRVIYPGRATGLYLKTMARQIWILEKTGATHFGGVAVLGWYVVKRARAGEGFLELTSYLNQLWHERMRT